MRLLQGLARTGLVATLYFALLGSNAAYGQVVVAIGDVSAAVGQEVEVPIQLSGVAGGPNIASFQLTVAAVSGSGSLTGHVTSGTLTASGWSVGSNTSNGRVGGFATSGGFASNGTLIILKLRSDVATTATIELQDFKLNGDSAPTHTPATPTFTFTAGSGGGGGNTAPVASNRSVTTAQNTAVVVTLLATDANSDPLTYSIVSNPTNGALSSVTGNQVTYTPTSGFTGSDSFTYRANDGTVNSNTATVSITVNSSGGGGNATPIANDDAYATDEDTPLSIAAPGLLTNDTDGDGNSLTAELETSPDNGSVTVTANGSFAYTPNANFNGTDTFTYVANDGTVDSTPATVTLTINAVNDAPIAQNQTVTTDIETAKTVTLVATDVENNPLTYSILAPPLNGSLGAVSGNQVTYTPNTGFSGTDNFVFRASDGSANSNNATVTINVRGNQAPVANDDSYTLEEDDILSVTGAGVLGNDTDADSDALTATLVDDVSNGTLTFGSTGGFFYEPAANFNGVDSFTYRANDGTENSNLATVTLNVTPTGSARIQVIHNAPDASVDPADVYLNGELFLLNAPYGHASPFVDQDDGTTEIVLSPNGAGVSGAAATFSTALEEGESYILILGGNQARGFDLHAIPNAEESTLSDRFEAFFFQGSPDAPTVSIVNVSDDLNNPGEVTVLSSASFGDYSPYLPNTPDEYNFEVRTAGGSEVETFRLDLDGGAGVTYAVVLSGLLGGGGYPLTMRAYAPSGNRINGDIVTSIEPQDELVPKTFLLRGNYPNPFNPRTNIQFDLPEAAEVGVRVTDLLGREMLSVPAQQFAAGTNLSIPIDASELASGIYIYRVEARAARDNHVATGTMTLIK